MRRLLASIRDWFDGRLHARRRRLAERRLKSVPPKSIVFVCLGNICRSPYGERVLSKTAGQSLAVDSAGFILPGRPPPDEALAAARASGIDHSDHRSKELTPDMLDRADAVFAFDRKNVRRILGTPGARADRIYWLGDFDPKWSGKRAIADPWGKSAQEFERTFARIEECVKEVFEILSDTEV